MPDIKVVLADDHPIVLAGIRSLLVAMEGIQLVGEATTVASARQIIATEKPDVAVIDLSFPDGSGQALSQAILAESPQTKILVLTVHEDQAYVQSLLQLGCRGYLLKRSAAEDLLNAIQAVHDGGLYLDPAVTEKAIAGPEGGLERGKGESLSPRERDVVRLTAQGFSNKEIAAKIDVSVKSVETYKARALEKLAIRTRAEIVRYGAAQGWLDQLPPE